MSDLIDKQAAIEAMRKCQTYRFSATEPRMIMLAAAEEVIEELPSAQPEHAICYLDSPCEYQNSNIELPPEQPEQRWIPCSERLPETNGRYIVTRGLKACNSIWNRVYIINYSDLMGLIAGKIWWDGNAGKSDFQKINDVIAWMPVPEVYKGEQE